MLERVAQIVGARAAGGCGERVTPQHASTSRITSPTITTRWIGARIQSTNPATEHVIAEFEAHTPEHADAALAPRTRNAPILAHDGL